MSETLNLAFALTWLLAMPSAQAEEARPDVLLKSVSEEVIAEINRSVPAGATAKGQGAPRMADPNEGRGGSGPKGRFPKGNVKV